MTLSQRVKECSTQTSPVHFWVKWTCDFGHGEEDSKNSTSPQYTGAYSKLPSLPPNPQVSPDQCPCRIQGLGAGEPKRSPPPPNVSDGRLGVFTKSLVELDV